MSCTWSTMTSEKNYASNLSPSVIPIRAVLSLCCVYVYKEYEVYTDNKWQTQLGKIQY